MAGSTVISLGSVTVTSNGVDAGAAIQQVKDILEGTLIGFNTVAGDGDVPTVAAADFGKIFLEVPSNINAGVVSLPAGYAYVLVNDGSTVTLTGGDAATTILGGTGGSFNYSGGAGNIESSATTSNVTDTVTGAIIEIDGSGTVKAAAGTTVKVDNGSNVDVRTIGGGSTVDIGSPTIAGPNLSLLAQLLSPTNTTTVVANASGVYNERGLSATLVLNTGASTVNLFAGNTTAFAGSAGNVFYGNGGSLTFIGGNNASTVFGGSASDAIFSGHGGELYVEGSGTANAFIGNSDSTAATSTILGGGSGAFFGGVHGDSYYLQSGTNVFVASSGSDTLYGGTHEQTVFGSNASGFDLSLVGTAGGVLVTGHGSGTIDASLTSTANNFFDAYGSNTLIGGSGTNLYIVAADTTTSVHNITIENWHAGDAVFLKGFDAASVTAAENAVISGSSTLKLSDNTTITFVGNHPTGGSGGAIF